MFENPEYLLIWHLSGSVSYYWRHFTVLTCQEDVNYAEILNFTQLFAPYLCRSSTDKFPTVPIPCTLPN